MQSSVKLLVKENLVMFINLLVCVFCICNEGSLDISLFPISFKSVIRLVLPTILVRTQIRNMLGGEIGKFTSGKNKVTI